MDWKVIVMVITGIAMVYIYGLGKYRIGQEDMVRSCILKPYCVENDTFYFCCEGGRQWFGKN